MRNRSSTAKTKNSIHWSHLQGSSLLLKRGLPTRRDTRLGISTSFNNNRKPPRRQRRITLSLNGGRLRLFGSMDLPISKRRIRGMVIRCLLRLSIKAGGGTQGGLGGLGIYQATVYGALVGMDWAARRWGRMVKVGGGIIAAPVGSRGVLRRSFPRCDETFF